MRNNPTAIPKSQHPHPAFTIVELLIVIVVIGILAAITIVAYNGMQNRARAATLRSDLRQAITQLELVKTKTGQYAESADNLDRSDVTAYQYISTDDSYCITATGPKGVSAYHATQAGSVTEGPCEGHFSSVVATGGTVTEAEEGGITYRIHTFTASGTFTATQGLEVEYLVVAGGGGGGGSDNSIRGSGGGGAGGLIQAGDSLDVDQYSIVVGSGGAGGTGRNPGQNGRNSSFNGVTAIGGGGGGFADNGSGHEGAYGGSGGGAGAQIGVGGSASSGQGHNGGSTSGGGLGRGGAGGGGAGGAGSDGQSNSGSAGGPGLQVWGAFYAGGGGGGQSGGGAGGSGVGGHGNGSEATADTGSGGGGVQGVGSTGGSGGGGIVIIRYKVD